MPYEQETLSKKNLERKLCEEFSVSQVCLSSNGTHAIEVLLTAFDLPRGAKVIVPEMTFMATATAVARVGLVPVLADVDLDYLGLSLKSIQSVYSEDVAAVLLVHLAGFVNRDMAAIKSFCDEKAILIIEDCAQAHYAFFQSQRVGSLGAASTFSFQSSKLFNCGEGGAIFSSDENLINRCKSISSWGWPGEGFAAQLDLPSSNYRLSNLQADYLLEQLEQREKKVAQLRERYFLMTDILTKLGRSFFHASFSGEFIDSPFFIVVKDCNATHKLEPRSQYPLSQSSVVEAIFRKWFPDLLTVFKSANEMSLQKNKNSYHIADHYSFVRIGLFDDLDQMSHQLNQL
jgi:dTDP-4-amino-4,6-dideoxygalactose transaminase